MKQGSAARPSAASTAYPSSASASETETLGENSSSSKPGSQFLTASGGVAEANGRKVRLVGEYGKAPWEQDGPDDEASEEQRFRARRRKKSPFLEKYRPPSASSAGRAPTPTLMTTAAVPLMQLALEDVQYLSRRAVQPSRSRPATAGGVLMGNLWGPKTGGVLAETGTSSSSSSSFLGTTLTVRPKSSTGVPRTRRRAAVALGGALATYNYAVASTAQSAAEDEDGRDGSQKARTTKTGGTLRPTSVQGLFLDGNGNYVAPNKAEIDTVESKRKLLHVARKQKYGEQVAARRRSFWAQPSSLSLPARVSVAREMSDLEKVGTPTSPLDDVDLDGHGVVAERVRKQQQKQQKLFNFVDEKMQMQHLKIRNYVPPPKKYRNLQSAFADLNSFEKKIHNRRIPLITIDHSASSNASTTASTPTDELGKSTIHSASSSSHQGSKVDAFSGGSSSSSKMSGAEPPLLSSPLLKRILGLTKRLARLCADNPEKQTQQLLLNKGGVGSLLHSLGNILAFVDAEERKFPSPTPFRKHCPVFVNYLDTLPKLSRTERILTPAAFGQENLFEFFQQKLGRELDHVNEFLNSAATTVAA
ncbi:unnamed protein product [Amoebophrya sp. A120]|nr:unnamed protein product [Amoebophrya sp. A120]|eukprot:GSA120T00003093001.1